MDRVGVSVAVSTPGANYAASLCRRANGWPESRHPIASDATLRMCLRRIADRERPARGWPSCCVELWTLSSLCVSGSGRDRRGRERAARACRVQRNAERPASRRTMTAQSKTAPEGPFASNALVAGARYFDWKQIGLRSNCGRQPPSYAAARPPSNHCTNPLQESQERAVLGPSGMWRPPHAT